MQKFNKNKVTAYGAVWITVATMQWFSLKAPQQPKKLMKKITTPTPIRIMGAAEAVGSVILRVLLSDTWTMIPTTISARPHSCKNKKKLD